MATIREIFSCGPEFCNVCGSILPVRKAKATDNVCPVCKTPIIRDENVVRVGNIDILETASYVVHFNDHDVYSSRLRKEQRQKRHEKNDVEGPVVARDCKQCGHTKMSYATVQLRSADEGQTVFFTCVKCKFKESENS